MGLAFSAPTPEEGTISLVCLGLPILSLEVAWLRQHTKTSLDGWHPEMVQVAFCSWGNCGGPLGWTTCSGNPVVRWHYAVMVVAIVLGSAIVVVTVMVVIVVP